MHQTSLNTNKPDKQQRKGQMLSYLLFIEVKEYLGSGPAITSASRSGSRLSMLTRLQTSPISVQETSLRPNISERTSPSDDDRDDATMTNATHRTPRPLFHAFRSALMLTARASRRRHAISQPSQPPSTAQQRRAAIHFASCTRLA